MFCRKCGAKIPDDSQFCVKCGVGVIAPNSTSPSATGTAVAVAPALEPSVLARTSKESVPLPSALSAAAASSVAPPGLWKNLEPPPSTRERVIRKLKVGRIGRLEYATWLFPTLFLEVVCMAFSNVVLAVGNEGFLAGIAFLAGITCISLFVFSFFLAAERAHDLDITN